MQPKVPVFAVPGAPVLVSTQKSLVMPHCPQILQQAFNGQGFISVIFDDASVGALEPGFCGPHTAFGNAAGKGGVPLLRQILVPTKRGSHPLQPQVFLLKSSRSFLVRLYSAARLSQLSLVTTWYVLQEPSLLGLGSEIWKVSTGAANVLLRHQRIAKVGTP